MNIFATLVIKSFHPGVNGTFISVVTGSSASLPCDIRPPSPRSFRKILIMIKYKCTETLGHPSKPQSLIDLGDSAVATCVSVLVCLLHRCICLSFLVTEQQNEESQILDARSSEFRRLFRKSKTNLDYRDKNYKN